VGTEWNAVYSEAVSRLDRPDPVFTLGRKTSNRPAPAARTPSMA